MTPHHFKEANCVFKAPPDVHETACLDIHAYKFDIPNGPFEGATQVVVAWSPTEDDLDRIREGLPIFLTCIGTLPPHRLTTSFEDATAY